MPAHTRVLFVAFVSALLLLGSTIIASADVVANTRVTLGPFTMFGNPCDPADGPLTVTVIEHRLTRVEPDGTVVFHLNAYGTAVSANGTQYVILRTSTIETPSSGPVVSDIFIRRISHGEGDNAMIRISGIGTTTMTTSCVG
jgi:hypothetical protein